MAVNFVTCGDEAYADTMSAMTRNLRRLYPDCKVWIYDWGLEPQSVKRLQAVFNVEVVDWKEVAGPRLWLYRMSHRLGWRWYMKLVRHWPWAGRVLSAGPARLFGLELILIEKIRCFLDVSRRAGDQPIVFFDGDAFPVRPLPELIRPEIDLALTIRRPKELSWTFNACTVLNTGVIGFGADAKKRDLFLSRWLKEALKSRETIAEQTAMTRFFEAKDKDLLRAGAEGHVDIEGMCFSIRILAGDEYNFNHIEELIPLGGEIPETIRVLHFKSGRFRDPALQPIIAQADLNRHASA